MADPRERAAGLALKLLRTAAPSSGASENERTLAALRAAELVSEHNLSVVADEQEHERKARERDERRKVNKNWAKNVVDEIFKRASQEVVHNTYDWHEEIAQSEHMCSQCNSRIMPGEPCWFADGRGYIHHDITCAEGRDQPRRRP